MFILPCCFCFGPPSRGRPHRLRDDDALNLGRTEWLKLKGGFAPYEAARSALRFEGIVSCGRRGNSKTFPIKEFSLLVGINLASKLTERYLWKRSYESRT